MNSEEQLKQDKLIAQIVEDIRRKLRQGHDPKDVFEGLALGWAYNEIDREKAIAALKREQLSLTTEMGKILYGKTAQNI